MGILSCSFCDKSNLEVDYLIQGPGPDLNICNECVFLCCEIIKEHGEDAWARSDWNMVMACQQWSD